MFPLPTAIYVKAGLIFILLCGTFFAGWHTRDRDFSAYKLEVATAAKAQEAKVESIQQQHELVKKGISDEYDAKLSLLRNYYAGGVRQSDSSKLSGISPAATVAHATAAYNELAGKCSETTLMLVELQKWVTETYSVK